MHSVWVHFLLRQHLLPSIYDAPGATPGSEQRHEEDMVPLHTVQMKERTTEDSGVKEQTWGWRP